MDNRWSNALWQQFGAAIDMLDNALEACPPELWEKRLWRATPEVESEFWNLTFHTLYFLDYYLEGIPAHFDPPAPFTRDSQQPYSKEALKHYLAYTRKKCQETITAMTEESAARLVAFPWNPKNPISFWELLLYTMRHVQEHTAQLSLFLGQNATDPSALDEALDWVSRARVKSDQPGG